MRTLYHLWLSPDSRKIRLLLAEKGLEAEFVIEPVWERRDAFLRLNPAGDVPVLVDADGTVVVDGGAIAEYLEETGSGRPMLPDSPRERAEIRRLVAWFDRKMAREVTDPLIEERVLKWFLGMGQPDSNVIRAALGNLRTHLDYIAWLADRRSWLAGEILTLADLAAAAHLSCLDYVGDVAWESHPVARDWYARIKSRPSFRPLLTDAIPGLPPPRHYADLDF